MQKNHAFEFTFYRQFDILCARHSDKEVQPMNAIHGRTISVPKPQKQSGWKRFRKNFRVHKYYYLLMLPGIIALLVFRYVPMAGIVIAFKNFRIADGIFGSEWVGLKWFEMLFSNAEFTNVLFNTIYISILKIVFSFPAPILLALMINEVGHLKYKKVVQTTVYLPHFISWVVVGGIMMTILSPSVGVLSLFGAAKNPLLEPANFRWLVVISDIWKEAGWGTVVYLAAITSISPDLYEAATVDGATRFQKIWNITLPAISGTIAIMLTDLQDASL